MREIKFRAWDKINKTMYLDIHKLDSLNEKLSRPNEYEVMQYTGLKDKNGKEIYEGDILRYEVLFKTYVVEWKNDTHEWKLNNRNQRDKLEIIGNIHETKEESCK